MEKNLNRSPVVSTERFAVAKLELDSVDALTYGEVVDIPKDFVNVQRTPKQNTQKFFASGQTRCSSVSKMGGDVKVTLSALTADDEVLFFGKNINGDTSVITSNKDDLTPEVMAIYSTLRQDGTQNLYKIMKAKFTDGGENVETRDESGDKYQAVQISGVYEHTLKNGDDVHILKGVDPRTEEGKGIIDAWFATALGGLPADKYPTSEVTP